MRFARVLTATLLLSAASLQAQSGIPRFPLTTSHLAIEGPARPGAFVSDIGHRSAILGDEGGSFEVWTRPVKLIRDLTLNFKIPEYDEPIPAARVAQRVIARPEGLTIVYSNAAFTVREHVFVPLNEPGAIILLDVETVRPLDVLVRMNADFNLAWPGSFGGANNYWDEGRHAFYLSQGGVGLYSGFVGSPFAIEGTVHPAHDAPMVPSQFTLRFDPKRTVTEFIPIVVAGGAIKRDSSWAIYNRLLAKAPEYWRERVAHATAVEDSTLALRSPDRALNDALAWAGVNLDQALACNPDLGCGLVAGFGKAGAGNFRPGFAWYFGGDAAINSFAMSSYGQFDLVKSGMLFAAKYQRADGKIAHEISHAAARLPWFTDYPYTWYHGDTTPFWILANYEYWLASGDDGYLKSLWPQIVKAFRWTASVDADGDALPDIPKAGVGAIEVGGLGDNLHTDIYIAGVWIGALKGLRDMAHTLGDAGIERDAAALYQKASNSLEQRFWLPNVQRYAFGLLDTPRGVETNDALTVWPSTAISFNLLPADRADHILAEIAGPELTTDWGVRTLAKSHRLYDALHYNNGTVWPFATGFAALAQFRGHRSWSGWELVRDIARTTFDYSRGHNPELMSGQYYRPLDTAVPNQYFGTSMMATAAVRGLLGLEADAPRHAFTFAPHLPAEWDSVGVSDFRVGDDRVAVRVHRTGERYTIDLARTGPTNLTAHVSPALPLGASIKRVTVNGQPAQYKTAETPHDVHVNVDAPLAAAAQIVIEYAGGVEPIAPNPVVLPGDAPKGLRVIDFRRADAGYVVTVEGLAGQSYTLQFRGAAPLTITFPAGEGFVRREIRLPR